MVAFPSSGSGRRRVSRRRPCISIKLENIQLEMCWLDGLDRPACMTTSPRTAGPHRTAALRSGERTGPACRRSRPRTRRYLGPHRGPGDRAAGDDSPRIGPPLVTWDRSSWAETSNSLLHPPRPVPARASGRPHSTGPSPPVHRPTTTCPSPPVPGSTGPSPPVPVPAGAVSRHGQVLSDSSHGLTSELVGWHSGIRYANPRRGGSAHQSGKQAAHHAGPRWRTAGPRTRASAPANLCRVPGKPQRVRGKPQRVRGKPQREPGKPVWPVVSPMTHRNQPSHYLADQRAEKAQREGYPLKSPHTSSRGAPSSRQNDRERLEHRVEVMVGARLRPPCGGCRCGSCVGPALIPPAMS